MLDKSPIENENRHSQKNPLNFTKVYVPSYSWDSLLGPLAKVYFEKKDSEIVSVIQFFGHP